MKLFENRRLKGAISIFLVIITIPTMLFSAVLIDGSRMASARAMAQEATDLAAASVLASYNQTLKDQFGLFALSEKDPGKLESIYKESLNATLLASGMEADSTYSERLWEIMKTTMTGQKSYMDASFLNLYDFQVEESRVEPLYSLANQEVLISQMVEYSKFRGLYVMTDRMDIFNGLGNAKKTAEQNQVTSEVMEDKMEADEANAKADRALARLRDEIGSLNEAVGALRAAEAEYVTSLKARMEKLRIDNTDTAEDEDEEELTQQQKRDSDAYERRRSTLVNAVQTACRQAGAVLSQARKAKDEVEQSIERLEQFRSRNQGKAAGNEAVSFLIDEAGQNIDDYNEYYLPEIRNLIHDPVLNQMDQDTSLHSDMDQVLDQIHEAITKYEDVIEKMRENSGDEEDGEELEITEYYYYYLESSESTTDSGAVLGGRGAPYSYEPSVNGLTNYFNTQCWAPEKVNPSGRYEGTFCNEIDESFAQEQSGKKGSPDASLDGEAARGAVEDAVYNARPSKTFQPENGKASNTDFYNRDGNLSASKEILNQGKHSMILDVGEVMRDDVLCLTYMFGTFKTRLTGVKKFSSEGMSASDKSLFYMPEWRYAHPDGEQDMRLMPKKDRDTVLRSEIEYLVYGNKSDAANESAVYATIFAERMANNMIAMYAEKDVINPSCHAAAALASLSTLGVVPEPVFFWIFLTAWATAETLIEMDYLISGGYKIPLFKTSGNILLKEIPNGQGLITNYGQSGIFVSYEDYLLILLLLKGREKRIMRSADLIEMNMKKAGKAEFTMAEAYTYLHADTKLSIRYLFGNVMPFGESYQEKGFGGRMHFTNTIYQGY